MLKKSRQWRRYLRAWKLYDQKGKYLGLTIYNWKDNIPKIGQTFDKMAEDQRVEKTAHQ